MYRAEIHGKISSNIENKEDVLTSNVFSFFKYANRNVFLLDFLKNFGLNISPEDVRNAIFKFWPIYDDNTEPDLIIIVGNYYILVEAKYYSGFGQENGSINHQLIREYEGGKVEADQYQKKFIFLVITADHFYDKNIFNGVPEIIVKEIVWVNWQFVTIFLENQLVNCSTLSLETIGFAEDLIELLQKKGLRGYAGFERCMIDIAIIDVPNYIFLNLETIKFKGIFQGFTSISIPLQIQDFSKTDFFFKRKKFFNNLDNAIEILGVENDWFFRR